MAKISNHARSLQIEISKVCHAKAFRHAFRDKDISDDHAGKRKKVLNRMCIILIDECKFKVKKINNIKVKHILAYAEWLDQSGISPRSIINNLSILRVFFHRVLFRPGVVPSVKKLFPGDDRFYIKTATTEDKSWREKGVNFEEIFKAIFEKDPYVAVQVLLCAAFGLRRREAICFRPNECVHEDYIEIIYGPKNGRERRVYIINDVQRKVLDYVKQFVDKSYGSTVSDGYTLKQWKSHFDYIVREYGHITKNKLGVTVHGLRHEYLGDLYELITGFPSPVRGHNISRPEELILDRIGRALVTDQAGHGRLNIPSAYLGAMQGRLHSQRVELFFQNLARTKKLDMG